MKTKEKKILQATNLAYIAMNAHYNRWIDTLFNVARMGSRRYETEAKSLRAKTRDRLIKEGFKIVKFKLSYGEPGYRITW
jgi:hypothetical protein